MSDPGAPSAAVAETTTTAGIGSYQLNPNPPNALSAYFRFADVFADGEIITYEVDDTQSKEIVTGTYHMLANMLTRDTVLFSSNSNALVDWPVTGQRTVRPLVGRLTICNIVRVTDGTVGPSLVLTTDNNYVIWSSAAVGAKSQQIPAAANSDCKILHIKIRPSVSDTLTITPEAGTIEEQASIDTSAPINVMLLADGTANNWDLL